MSSNHVAKYKVSLCFNYCPLTRTSLTASTLPQLAPSCPWTRHTATRQFPIKTCFGAWQPIRLLSHRSFCLIPLPRLTGEPYNTQKSTEFSEIYYLRAYLVYLQGKYRISMMHHYRFS